MDSEHIKDSHTLALKNNKEKYLNGKLAFIKDPLPDDIDLDYVLCPLPSIAPLNNGLGPGN